MVGGQEPGGSAGHAGARAEGGGQARTERFRGLAVVGSEPDKKTDFEFFWGREEGSWSGGRQRRELGGGS